MAINETQITIEQFNTLSNYFSLAFQGIRFNYYDDIEENRKITQEPSAAQRVNEGLLNGQKGDTKPSTEDQAIADQNVLKIAVGVEEDACQVVPVGEIEGDKGTEANDKGSPEVKNYSLSFLKFKEGCPLPLS